MQNHIKLRPQIFRDTAALNNPQAILNQKARRVNLKNNGDFSGKHLFPISNNEFIYQRSAINNHKIGMGGEAPAEPS